MCRKINCIICENYYTTTPTPSNTETIMVIRATHVKKTKKSENCSMDFLVSGVAEM